METAKMSINRGMGREDVVHIDNGILAIKGTKPCHLQKCGWTQRLLTRVK